MASDYEAIRYTARKSFLANYTTLNADYDPDAFENYNIAIVSTSKGGTHCLARLHEVRLLIVFANTPTDCLIFRRSVCLTGLS